MADEFSEIWYNYVAKGLGYAQGEIKSLLRDVLLELSERTPDAIATCCRQAGGNIAVVAGNRAVVRGVCVAACWRRIGKG